MKKKTARYLIFALIGVMIIAMLLMALGRLDPIVFWVIIILGGIFAFRVLPKWKLT